MEIVLTLIDSRYINGRLHTYGTILVDAPTDPTSSVVSLTAADAEITCTITGEATVKHSVTWYIAGTVYEAGAVVLDPNVLVTSLVLTDVTVTTTGVEVSEMNSIVQLKRTNLNCSALHNHMLSD